MLKTPASLAVLRASLDAKLAAATEEHRMLTQLLDVLPAHTPAPHQLHAFGFCASYTLVFQGAGLVERLLDLYPPLPLHDVKDAGCRTQMPAKCQPNPKMNRVSHPLYPVVFKSESNSLGKDTAQWWTETPQGDVMVQVQAVPRPEGYPDPVKYDTENQPHATGRTLLFRRKLALAENKRTPLQEWNHRKGEYPVNVGMDAKQKTFFFALSAQAKQNGLALTLADLPEPNYLRAGSAIAFGEGEDLVEGLEKLAQMQRERPEHWLDRIGDFWNSFNSPEAQQMLGFINLQTELHPAAITENAEVFNQVEAVLRSLFQDCAALPRAQLAPISELANVEVFNQSGWTPRLQLSVDALCVTAWVRLGLEIKTFVYPFKDEGKQFPFESIKVNYL